MIRIIKTTFNFLFAGSIARNSFKTSGILGVRLLVQSATIFLLAKILGAEQFALFVAISATAILLGVVATMGSNLVLLSETSRNHDKQYDVLTYVLPGIIISGAIAFVIYTSIIFFIFDYATEEPGAVVAIGVAEIFLSPFILLIAAGHQAKERILYSQLLTFLPLLFRLILVVVLWQAQPSKVLALLLWSYLVASALAFLISLHNRTTSWPNIYKWRLPKRAELNNASAFSLINFLSLATAEVDKVLAFNLLSASAAGIYALSARIIGALTLPIGAIIVASLPRLFRAGIAHHTDITKWIFFIGLAYSFSAGLCLWWGAGYLAYFFGNGFEGLEVALKYISLVVPALVLRIIAGNILMTRGQTWLRFIYEAIGLLALTLLFFLLSAPFNINGLIGGLAIAEWMMATVGWLMIAKLGTKHISPNHPENNKSDSR